MRYLLMLVALVMLLGLALGLTMESSPTQAEPAAAPANKAQSLMEKLRADRQYLILVAAIKDSELERTLSGEGRFTFFAPTNEAFGHMPKMSEILHNQAELLRILERHLVVDRVVNMEELRTLRTLQPKGGELLSVKPSDSTAKINDGKIVAPDLVAQNGVVHGVDRLLTKDNDSALGDAGRTIEHGLKEGARKIKDAFSDDKSEKKEADPKQ